MQGPIAQIMSLTLAGNAAARGHDLGSYWPDDDAFKFCRSIRFFDGSADEPDDRLTLIAGDPGLWLRHFGASGARVLLTFGSSARSGLSDRLSVGFVGGGGVWSMTVAGATPVAGTWQAHWCVGDRQAADRRIWEVGYFRQSAAAEMPASDQPRLPDLVVALETTLGAIADFAYRQNLAQFGDCFVRARHLLVDTSVAPARPEIDPFGLLPASALRLLMASEAAWVFGGMGSWNDLGFSGADGQLYERLSDDLFGLLTQTMVAAVNQAATPG